MIHSDDALPGIQENQQIDATMFARLPAMSSEFHESLGDLKAVVLVTDGDGSLTQILYKNLSLSLF